MMMAQRMTLAWSPSAKMPSSAMSSRQCRRPLRLHSRSDDAAAAPRVRSYFPEALYINPEILTDANGNADIAIPLADSITTWRMAMLASTQSGALGTATGAIKVFQDFFVDLDLPVTLTQGDRVTLPVAIYNYAGARGEVSLSLQQTTGSLSSMIQQTRLSAWKQARSARRNTLSRPTASASSSSRSPPR
jgi:uncharacterized protein YfaS (alpha-2-macroglobulin family)